MLPFGATRFWLDTGAELAELKHVEMSITAPPTVGTPPSVRETTTLDDRAGRFDGWFCIRTDPFPCPADGCPFVATFQTAAHLIVVWERIDAQTLLVTADRCKRAGRNPRIIEYEDDYGLAIAWEQWIDAGRPVHAFADRPQGWDGGMRL